MSNEESAGVQTPRPRRPWPKYCGFALAFMVLYVASIGPLAGLEAHGYGSRGFWRGLKLAYIPVFWSWKYGPDWWADGIGNYTALFHQPQSWLYDKKFFASPNNADSYRECKQFLDAYGMPEPQLSRELDVLERSCW